METDCIINFVTNTTKDSSSEDCPEAVLEEFEDQSLKVLNLTSPWSLILIVGVIGCTAINVAGKIFIMWFVKSQSIERPLNALILIDQGVQLPPVLVNGIATTSSLILKEPLVNFVGHTGCRIWHYFRMIHFLSLVIGGVGMAAYRLAIYNLAHRISDCKIIRKVILLIEVIAFLVMLATSILALSLNNTAPPHDFCEGHTPMARKVINQYGEVEDSVGLAKQILGFQIVIMQSVIIGELICYMILYYRKKMDNLSASPMTKNLNKRRNRQHTITLTGQIISFAIETAFTIVLMIVRSTAGFEASYMPISLNVKWLSITLTVDTNHHFS